MSSKNVNSFSTIDTVNTYSNSSLLGIVSGNLTRLTSGNLVLNKVNASNLIYNTGNQTISGAKSFSDRITFLNSTATYPFNPTISGGASIDNEATLDIDAFKLNLRAGYGKSEYIELGGEEGRLNINTVADTSTFNLGYNHNSSSTGIYNITSPSINLYGQVNGQTGTFEKLYAHNLVYNTGNQTISGTKTFASPIVFPSGANDGIYLGGSGGTIDLRAGAANDGGAGGGGGNIIMKGGDGGQDAGSGSGGGAGSIDLSGATGGDGSAGGGGSIILVGAYDSSSAGSINLSGGGGGAGTHGGSIISTGSEGGGSGGTLNMSAVGGGGGGGSIDTSGGGSINTSNNGGSIDTRAGATNDFAGGSGGDIIMKGGDGGIAGQGGAIGGDAGSIDLSGGPGDTGDGLGGDGGSIILAGGYEGADAGSINLSGGGQYHHGGSITSTGNDEHHGGSLNMSAGDGEGGSINTSSGGSINTSNGGGSIDLSENSGANFSIQTGNLPTQNDGSIYNKINDSLYIRKNNSWEKVITNVDNPIYTTGNQTIFGNKSFYGNIIINNLTVTGTETIVNTSVLNVSNPYILLNISGGATDGGIFFVTGVGLTGINDTGPIIGFDHTNKFKFGISTRNSDLSPLPDIASVQEIIAYSGIATNTFSTITNLATTGNTLEQKISSLSGTLTSTYATISNLANTGSTLATNLASTGSTLDTKINNLSGVSVLTFGNQTIGGLKNFTSLPTVNNTGVLLSGSTPFVLAYGHPRDNTAAGDLRRYFGPPMDIGPVNLGSNEKRRSRVMKDCFLREVSWAAVVRDNPPTPSNAMTGYFKNFGNNPLGNDSSVGNQVTFAINLPTINEVYNYSTGNLNIPIKAGDYVSFYYQTNFNAGSNNLASGLSVNVDAYFYV